MGRGTDPQWRMMMELVEKSGERERERDHEICELKEALKYRRENLTERNEAERSSQMNESPTYHEKKNEEAPYHEDNERERENQEAVQQRRETIEKSVRVVEQDPERVNASSERVGEPHTIIAKQNKPQSAGERLNQGETQGSSEETAQFSNLNYGVSQSPNAIIKTKGSEGTYHHRHNLFPEALQRMIH
ncbi:MAG: hypothetical protein GY820_35265, partial [Gammaproteobacteria bacterium]|nr:hypothetical protein [Gammaproteobacteria bacterium]